MTHVDLFSGIGGFALAARCNGIRTQAFFETDPYCSRVLEKNFPGVPNFGDVRNATTSGLRFPFLVTGGFPCQPFSCAGKRAGKSDDRYLWPAMRNTIDALRPAWVLGENVPGIIGMELHQVLADLERLNYSVQTFVIPACAADAHHRRDRVWIVAHADCRGQRQSSLCQEQSRGAQAVSASQDVAHATCGRAEPKEQQRQCNESGIRGEDVADTDAVWELQPQGSIANERRRLSNGSWWHAEPDVGRVANGVPNRVDRLKGLGNAIVPQIATELIRLMITATQEHQ